MDAAKNHVTLDNIILTFDISILIIPGLGVGCRLTRRPVAGAGCGGPGCGPGGSPVAAPGPGRVLVPPAAGSGRGPSEAGSDRGPPAAGCVLGPPAAGIGRGPPAAGRGRGPPAAGCVLVPPAVCFLLYIIVDTIDTILITPRTSAPWPWTWTWSYACSWASACCWASACRWAWNRGGILYLFLRRRRRRPVFPDSSLCSLLSIVLWYVDWSKKCNVESVVCGWLLTNEREAYALSINKRQKHTY